MTRRNLAKWGGVLLWTIIAGALREAYGWVGVLVFYPILAGLCLAVAVYALEELTDEVTK